MLDYPANRQNMQDVKLSTFDDIS